MVVTSAKKYQVLVHGDFPEKLAAAGFLYRAGGVIRKKRTFSFTIPENLPYESADTVFHTLKRGGGFSLLQAELGTGRMHQIRATLCSLGFPVAGDKLYGVDERFYLKLKEDSLSDGDRAKLLLDRQALHCCKLNFLHPYTGENMEFESELPEKMAKLMR